MNTDTQTLPTRREKQAQGMGFEQVPWAGGGLLSQGGGPEMCLGRKRGARGGGWCPCEGHSSRRQQTVRGAAGPWETEFRRSREAAQAVAQLGGSEPQTRLSSGLRLGSQDSGGRGGGDHKSRAGASSGARAQLGRDQASRREVASTGWTAVRRPGPRRLFPALPAGA